jgi:methylmalonyl-CoA mutase C-terminal domain/subunit
VAERIRVVIAKPGLDGHDRGVKLVARALRDAGMEVVYTGLHQTPEQIVQTVIQEDADAVGLSVLSGAHMTLFRRTLELLQENRAEDVVLFGGGIIPDEDLHARRADGRDRRVGPLTRREPGRRRQLVTLRAGAALWAVSSLVAAFGQALLGPDTPSPRRRDQGG